jgi:uncharacterized protein YjbI with pentapeptide repeats
MSLLASTPHSDLTCRDFSECAIPHSYICRKNLSKSKLIIIIYLFLFTGNFRQSDVSGCKFLFTELKECNFELKKEDK